MRGSRRAVALVTVLLVSVLMLILGLSFLSYLERDYRFAGQQTRSQQAYYLALAGLQYQRSRPDRCHAGAPMPVVEGLPKGDNRYYFELNIDSLGKITSRGVVKSPLGVVIAERTLVVEPGQGVRAFHDTSR